jgi:ferredoxin-NADP reductase
VLRVGDQVEVRGPIGGYFVWEPALGGPLLLVAGGSGVVPLMAMLRERAAAGDATPTALLYSSRTVDDVIYRGELPSQASSHDGLQVFQTLTRSQPPGWTGYARRIDREMLSDVLQRLGPQPLAYICGPTLLVEAAANGLVELGVPPARVRTERFGPTT